ncbi:MAG: ribonuclease H-like domain-containing protein, partial [Bacteroidota bacterium]
MLQKLDISNILFFDAETVSGKATYEELSEPMQELWRIKCKSILRQYDEEISPEQAAELYPEKAGIYAEFGKIVCISVGIVVKDGASGRPSLRLKSFANQDEAVLLTEFCELINQYYGNPNKHYFCGHNIREFDIPYVCRRLLINQLPLPGMLNISGKKPWELKYFLDTLEMWKFGDYKNYTSLKLLAAVFGFPSPKDDIDGSMVGRVFWQDDELDRISQYCEKDVLAVVQLLLRYLRMPLLEED